MRIIEITDPIKCMVLSMPFTKKEGKERNKYSGNRPSMQCSMYFLRKLKKFIAYLILFCKLLPFFPIFFLFKSNVWPIHT